MSTMKTLSLLQFKDCTIPVDSIRAMLKASENGFTAVHASILGVDLA
jgi:hypothetical protein